MASTVIKPEIKIDAAEESKNLADIEAFEEDNDLKFPDPGDTAWLIKLPTFVWQKWNSLYAQANDNERIQIGTLRIKNDHSHIQIRLDTSIPEQKLLPPTYDLELSSRDYNNTVVFSEKDIPGYRPRARNYNRVGKFGGIPTKQERYGEKMGYRSAIPKQTALAPLIVHEGKIIPVENEEYAGFMDKLWESIMPQGDIELVGMERNRQQGLNNLSAFSTTSKVGGKGADNKKKARKEKAVRMDRDALIDALMRCFKRYKYWRLQSLRKELNQPEAYIKETLDDVAVLVKSGDFAMTWKLKPAYQVALEQQQLGEDAFKEEIAKVESGTDANSADDMVDDDDEDFEDVRIEGQ